MSSSQEISVELILPSGESLGPSSVPTSHTVAVIISEMIEAFSLPMRSEGKPIAYELFWEQQGQLIALNQTLSSAGVKDGDQLKLRAPAESLPPVALTAAKAPGTVGSGENTIPVKIEFYIDNFSRESIDETLVYDDTVRSVIDQLIKRLELPRTISGGPAVYKLRSKALGSELSEGLTLRQLYIPKNDSLKLSAERPAG
jgi:uncharacterized ubiquitin-like protein YukD